MSVKALEISAYNIPKLGIPTIAILSPDHGISPIDIINPDYVQFETMDQVQNPFHLQNRLKLSGKKCYMR